MKRHIFAVNVIITLLIGFFSLKCTKDNGPATITWNTVFSDDFQRTDGSLGTNYSVQVVSGNGTANISGNKLKFEGSGYWAIRYLTGVPGDLVRASVNCSVENGNPNFGIAAKGQGYDSQNIEGYFALISSNKIGICKYKNIMDTLILKSFTIQNSHIYKLQFIVDSRDLSAYIEDLNSGVKDSIKVTDIGTLLTGTTVSLNGNNPASTDVLLFDDFKIETGIK